MSVASKTTTKVCTIVAFGMMVVLSALPTWASTSPEIGLSTMWNASTVVSTSQTQDISVLWDKLKERFSWISQEVVSLVQWTTLPRQSFHGSPDVPDIDLREWILVPNFVPVPNFVDVDGDPYAMYIKRLAAYDVLSPSQKFYPQNYFRTDDFVWLITKLYQKKTDTTLDTAIFAGIDLSAGYMTKWMLQQIMISLDIDTIAIDGDPYDKLIRSEWAYYLVRMFDLPPLETSANQLLSVPHYFSDIVDHPFAFAINTLANLNIVSTQSSKFYPDNYLRHYDFVTMLVNALLYDQSGSLSTIPNVSFADVSSTSPYFAQLAYVADRGIIDDIVVSKRGQLYFEPNAFMTKQQVYTLLSKSLGVDIRYDTQASQESMTRAEMAQLLVTGFWFEPKILSSDLDSSEDIDDDALLQKLKILLSML